MANTTLKHPKSGRTVTVPADTADFYKEHGWVVPGTSAEEQAAGQAPAQADAVIIPDGEPVEEWKAKEITAWAERESLDLGGASTKAEMIAAIAEARAAKQDPDPASGTK